MDRHRVNSTSNHLLVSRFSVVAFAVDTGSICNSANLIIYIHIRIMDEVASVCLLTCPVWIQFCALAIYEEGRLWSTDLLIGRSVDSPGSWLLKSRADNENSLQYEGSRWAEVVGAADLFLIDFDTRRPAFSCRCYSDTSKVSDCLSYVFKQSFLLTFHQT